MDRIDPPRGPKRPTRGSRLVDGIYPYMLVGEYQPGKYQDLVVGIYNNNDNQYVLIKRLKSYMASQTNKIIVRIHVST